MKMPASRFPEIVLPAPPAVPPTTLFGEPARRTPSTVFPTAAVPLLSRPMVFATSWLPDAPPTTCTPSTSLPEMTLPAPTAPTTLLDEPWIETPDQALPRSPPPAAPVPMKLPSTWFADEPFAIVIPFRTLREITFRAPATEPPITVLPAGPLRRRSPQRLA